MSIISRNTINIPLLSIPYSVLILHMIITVSILSFSRILIKYIYGYLVRSKEENVHVMIYGAGDLGSATLAAMQQSGSPVYHVQGFIDTNRSLHGKSKDGISIYSPTAAMRKVLPSCNIQLVVVAISNANLRNMDSEPLYNYCIKQRIEVRKIPDINEWINGTFDLRQMKKIAIEDLLSRPEIVLNLADIQNGLENRTILVTGAAGSIGSEIVRQLMLFQTGKIVLLDQAESPLHDLQLELKNNYNGTREFEVVIADVSNKKRMEMIFRKYRPGVVFHAAAYKHVPILEDNVCEAVRVNIGGTKLLADLAANYGVNKFVMVSTDKAVNPTGVMGATKRICEMYVQGFNTSNSTGTQFITTRFGNVLGSNGSVVPLFTRQIEAGGPVTITHKDMQRYFMTIPEACQLVLEAGFMGKGGEIYLFDMGKSVKIYDLAVKMISLAGFVPGEDIQIVETGLRPGEKLFEEMLISKEHHLPTHHEKILIANTCVKDYIATKANIEELIDAAMKQSEQELVGRIRALVPEFHPQNPKYREEISMLSR